MAKSIARNLADVASPTGVLDGTLSTAAQTNITSVGTLSSLTISGNLNATLTTAAQTNITSLGTLSSLNLSGALTGTTGTFTTADNLTQVRLISTDADASIGPRLDLFRNSASPAAGDFIGRVRFLAEDSTGAETAYIHFDSLIDDPTDGSEDGQLRIETKTNGIMKERIGFDSSETVINEDSQDYNFRVESDTNENMFVVNAGSNRVHIGSASSISVGQNMMFTIQGQDNVAGASIVRNSNDASGPAIQFAKSRGTAVNATTVVQSGDTLGNISFRGADGTDTNTSAGRIRVQVDGTPGSNDMPGRMLFETTPDGSTTPVEAMRINSSGDVGIRTGASIDAELHVNAASENVNLRLTRDTNYGVQISGTDGATNPVLRLATINNGTLTERIRMSETDLRPTTDQGMGLGTTSARYNGLQVKSTTSENVYISGESTTANSSFMMSSFNTTLSGSDSLTTDRANYGIYSALNSSATGGTTTNEHRIYGIRSLAKATGDSDLIYGGYFTGEAEHSSGTVSLLHGCFNQATADPNSGGTVSNTYGTYNQASINGSAGSVINNVYASWNKVLVGSTDVVAHVSLTGCYAEIETDASGTGRTTTNGYLFRGNYDDDSSGEHKFTNFYGLYLSGNDLSTRTDGTGKVAGVYLDMAGVDQGFWNSEDQPNYFRGSLGIGSGATQVGDTVGAELHLVEPDGGEMVLARYDATIGGGNSLGKILFGGTEDSGTTVNFSASIQAFAQSAHSTTDSDGYLSFYTTPNSSTTLIERMRINRNGYAQFTSGTSTAPGITFLNDINTGFNNASADNIGFVVGGSQKAFLSASQFNVTGNTVASGTKTFRVQHLLPSKKETHELVHASLEGPQLDLIYRGSVDLVGGSATVNIDTAAGMTDGTFVLLNTNVQCFTSNESGWTAIKGSVSANILTITAQDNDCTDTISWMVVGERQDQDILNNDMTDSDGKLIVEPLI